jgi:hypothetical protein
MRTIVTTSEAVSGAQIHLSAQELLVLSDFRDRIDALLEDWRQDDYTGKDELHLTRAVLSNMLDGIDIMSLQEAHDNLFSTPEKILMRRMP